MAFRLPRAHRRAIRIRRIYPWYLNTRSMVIPAVSVEQVGVVDEHIERPGPEEGRRRGGVVVGDVPSDVFDFAPLLFFGGSAGGGNHRPAGLAKGCHAGGAEAATSPDTNTSPAISSGSLKRTTCSPKALSRAVRSALARDLVDGRCLRALDLVPIDSPNSRGSDGILRDMTVARPAFARDPATAAYYDQCPAEYDE